MGTTAINRSRPTVHGWALALVGLALLSVASSVMAQALGFTPSSAFTFSLDENRAGTVPIGTVYAVGGNNPTYDLLTDSSDIFSRFRVDQASGVFRYIGSGEDYESTPSYTLMVQATSSLSTALSVTAHVTVLINDLPGTVQFFQKVYTSITGSTNSFSALGATFSPDGTERFTDVMGQVSASDSEGGDSITYSIIDGDSDNKFSIDKDGVVRYIGPGDEDLTFTPGGGSGYKLTIQASDGTNTDVAFVYLPVGICDRATAIQEVILTVLHGTPYAYCSGSNSLASASNLRAITETDILNFADLNYSSGSLSAFPLKSYFFSELHGVKGKLQFQNTELTGLPVGSFKHLHNIDWVNLTNTRLSALQEGVFTGLNSVKYLNLSDNRLSHLPGGLFANLTELEQLVLSANQLSHLTEGLFAGLTNLKGLALESNPGGTFSIMLAPEQLQGTSTVQVRSSMAATAVDVDWSASGSSSGAAAETGTVTIAAGTDTGLIYLTATDHTLVVLSNPKFFVDPNNSAIIATTGLDFVIAASGSPPFFINTPHLFRLDENLSGSTIAVVIGSVRALGGALNSSIRYSLTAGPTDQFSVDSESGQISYTGTGADFESTPSYTLTVQATDSEDRFTVSNVTVTIVNFLEFVSSSYVFKLGPTAAGVVVGTVSSTVTEGASVVYSIVTGDIGKFSIAADTIAADSGVIRYIGSGGEDVSLTPVYTLILTVSDGSSTVTSTVQIQPGICDRTLSVRDAIVGKINGVDNCIDVTAIQLGDIADNQGLDLSGRSLTALNNWDFAGLNNLQGKINLDNNQLSNLPVDVFDGLDKVEEINLGTNQLSNLPADVFDGLGKVEEIILSNNQLNSLPQGLFTGLTNLKGLALESNPGSAFSISLAPEQLQGTSTVQVRSSMAATAVDVDWSASGSSSGAAAETGTVTIAAGTDFGLIYLTATDHPLVVLSNPVFVDPNDSTIIPTTGLVLAVLNNVNLVDSELLFRLGPTTTTAGVVVGTLSAMNFAGDPLTHTITNGNTDKFTLTGAQAQVLNYIGSGGEDVMLTPSYTLILSTSDGTDIVTTTVRIQPGICDRTLEVRDGILNAISNATGNPYPDLSDCSDISREQLDFIGRDDKTRYSQEYLTAELSSSGIKALRFWDFYGLFNAGASINLSGNQLGSLPVGLFRDMHTVHTIRLQNNQLTILPEGAFAGPNQIVVLSLHNNKLSSLPKRLFYGFHGLRVLQLQGNPDVESSVDFPIILAPERLGASSAVQVRSSMAAVAITVVWSASSGGAEAVTGTVTIAAGTDTQALPVDAADYDRFELSDPAFVEVNFVDGFSITVASPPIFVDHPYEFRLDENAPGAPGPIPIGTVTANTHSGASPTYDLISGTSGRFSVNDNGAVSYIGSGEDFESTPSYSLTVQATDSGFTFTTTISNIAVTVTVTNLNDNPPEFTSASYQFILGTTRFTPTAAVLGTVLGTVSAVDPDGGSFAFEVTAGDLDRFAADANGEIWYRGEGEDITFSPDSYTLTLTVNDGSHTATAAVYIRVMVGICDRIQPVRDSIIYALRDGNKIPRCENITVSQLNSIASDVLSVYPASNRSITALRSWEFAGLTSVVIDKVDLSNNLLSTLPVGLFDDLPSVPRLELQNNRLTGLPEGIFSELSNLEVLDLNHNQLSSLPENIFLRPDGVFSEFPDLRVLDLSHNQLTSLPENIFLRSEGIFSKLSNLEVLSLNHNEFTSLPEGIFSEYPNLEVLSLNHNEFTSLPENIFLRTEGIFSELPDLRVLNLNSNQFTSLPEGIFSKLSNLKILNLNHNQLSRLPTDTLQLGKLENIDLSYNHIKGDAYDDIEGAYFDPVYPVLFDSDGIYIEGVTRYKLPGGLFTGMTSLKIINLENNSTTSSDTDFITPYKVYLHGERIDGTTAVRVISSEAVTALRVEWRAVADDNATGGTGTVVIRDGEIPRKIIVDVPAAETGIVIIQAGTTASAPITLNNLKNVAFSVSDIEFTNYSTGEYSRGVQLTRVNETVSSILGVSIEITEPLFLGTPYAFTLAENQSGMPTAHLLGTVTTTDADGNMASYSLTAGAAARFSLGATSGVVSYIGAGENYESETTSYTLTVTATDSNSTALMATAQVTVTIADVPEAPVFDSPAYTFSLVKNAAGTLTSVIIGTVRATDADNTSVSYSLLVGSVRFSLGATSGVLNYIGSGESIATTLSLTVEASDGTLRNTVAVAVAVADDPPQFSATGSFFLTATNRALLGTVMATDANNDPITYSLIDNFGDRFSVATDSTGSGVISYIGSGREDVTVTASYELSVRATAGSGFAEATVTVNIGICDRTAPVRDGIVSVIGGACENVTVTALGEVTDALNLSSQTITSLVAVDFAGLDSIGILRLSENDLSSLPSGVFADLSGLTTLNLFENKLNTLSANVFSNLGNLTTLSLRDNRLSSLPSGVFDDLSLLERLYLSENKLSSLPSGVFDDLSGLTTLSLIDNELNTLSVNVFSSLGSLTTLSLNTNELSSLPANVFSSLGSLRSLSLNNNELSSLPANVFSSLGSLTTLSLNNNELSSLPANVFSSLGSLTTLSLIDNKLSSLPDNIFAGLTSLTALNLSSNPDPNAPVPFPVELSLEQVDATSNGFLVRSDFPGPAYSSVGWEASGSGVTGTTSGTVIIAAGTTASTTFNLPLGYTTVALTDSTFAANFEGFTTAIGLALTINHPPVFDPTAYSFTLAENQPGTPTAHLLGTVTATDADKTSVSYSLLVGTGSVRFSLDATSGVLSYIDTGEDYEARSDAYTLTVQATDSDSAALVVTAEVTVTIADRNDAPLFDSPAYSFTLAENQPGDAAPLPIGTVTATDADRNTVSYSLSVGTGSVRFSLDATSGVLSYISSGEDYETRSDAYTLTVQAIDGASTALVAVAQVMVNIANLNDNLPAFVDASYSFTLAENQPGDAAPLPIGTVEATDADGPPVGYGLSRSSATTHFSLDASNGVLYYIGSSEDYETRSDAYTLTVTAIDGASTDSVVTAQVTVDIANRNDSLPVFRQFAYIFELAENQSGTVAAVVIGTVAVTGETEGETVIYTLTAADLTRFTLAASGGVLSYIDSGEDYETPPNSYTLTVRASDSDSTALMVTAQVTVNIANRNDNPPMFATATYFFTLAENQSGTATAVVIGTVTTTDADTTDADRNTASYSLLVGTGSVRFSLDATSGVLGYIDTGEDYEARSDAYTLTVTASDSDSTALMATAQVTVNIANRNDNPPAFVGAPYSFTLAENQSGAPTAHLLGSVAATDPDGADVGYSLLVGAGSVRFSLDATSGVLSYIGSGEDFETRSDAYALTVQATDSDSTALVATAQVTVSLDNVNEAPLFDPSAYTFELAENQSGTPTAHLLGTVTTIDADENTASYSLTAGDATLFSLGATSGVLSYIGSGEDYETRSADAYTLTVQAIDSTSTALMAMAEVTVALANRNDAPAFDSPAYTFTLVENQSGTATPVVIGTVMATDADENTASYSLSVGDAALFSLAVSDGVLRYIGSGEDADSAPTRYTLTVQAIDAVSTALVVTAQVTVNIANVNDNPPLFATATYFFTLAENQSGTAAAVIIGSVRATDADGDAVTYAFGADTTLFSLDATNGVLSYIGSGEDFESATTSYTLNVVAASGALSASGAMTVSTTVTVRVTDVDETGAVRRRTEMTSMVLAQVGRNIAVDTVDVLGGRFAAAPHVTISGRSLNASQWSGLTRWMQGDYWQGVGAWNGVEREIGWDDIDLGAKWKQFEDRLLSGSSFLVSLGAAEGEASAGLEGLEGWSLWGQGRVSGYRSIDGGIKVSGKVLSGYLGVDYQASEQLLFGVAVSHSRSDGYSSMEADSSNRIDIDTQMAGVYPYLQWSSGSGFEFWGTIGRGEGEVEVKDGDQDLIVADLELMAVGLGFSRRLVTVGDAEITVKADGFLVQIQSEGVAGLNATDSKSHRLRAALAGNRRWSLGGNAGILGGVELGTRLDGGDGVGGRGLDIGANFGYVNPDMGLEAHSRIRFLVAHSEEYSDWGLDVTVRLQPPRWLFGRGLSLSVAPGWGQSATAIDSLWKGGISALKPAAATGRGFIPDRTRFSLRYGLHYRGALWSPFAEAGMDRESLSALKLGLRMDLSRLRVEAFGNQDQTIGIEGGFSF